MTVETFIFEGSVLPDNIPLTIDHTPVVQRRDASASPDAEFKVTVFSGRFQTRVSTEFVDEAAIEALYLPAWSLTQALVHSAGLISGVPYSATIERVLLGDGTVMQYRLGDSSLAKSHGLDQRDLEAIAELAMADMRVRLLLSDALMMLGVTDYSPIACGRVADAVARLITSDTNNARRWATVRAQLRVDEDFLRSLTEVSKAARHADRIEVSAAENRMTAHRAWALVGRCLHIILRGPLDEAFFPLLTGNVQFPEEL